MGRMRGDYLSLRGRYQPESVKLVIVAESPPTSGRYFYDPEGSVTEPLFAALMKQIGISPCGKEAGLRAFEQRGLVLSDATYTPVNGFSERKRNQIIEGEYPLLVDDLDRLTSCRSKPVVLIKANICRLLEEKLKTDGFNIINQGRIIYFPGSGQQRTFHRQFQAAIRKAGISWSVRRQARSRYGLSGRCRHD